MFQVHQRLAWLAMSHPGMGTPDIYSSLWNQGYVVEPYTNLTPPQRCLTRDASPEGMLVVWYESPPFEGVKCSVANHDSGPCSVFSEGDALLSFGPEELRPWTSFGPLLLSAAIAPGSRQCFFVYI